MSKPSDEEETWSAQREKIIGLGERSLRKTYYPELQQKIDELERFRALVDQSNDCIFLLEASSLTFVDVNESACRQLECGRDRFLTLPLATFVSAGTLMRIQDLVASRVTQGRDQDTITTDLYKCSGAAFPAEMTIRLVTFNKVLYGVAVARDISERKRAEKVHLENLRMLRELELARQIQVSLLPAIPPVIPGVELAGICVPATHVGGDYYDYHVRDGTIDLVIADVSGHSIGAALMMTEARSALHSQVRSFISPADILASLNDILYDDLDQAELFITLFYMKYDCKNGVLTYANAGHVLPLLFRNGGQTCEELDAEGLVLGIHKEVLFEEKRLEMQKGDVLLLYTDGITESENAAAELFGPGRLCSVLSASHVDPPQKIIDSVIDSVSTFTGTSTTADDMTMVAMKIV